MLALTGRIEPIPKKFKIPKPIQNLLKEYNDIIFKESHDLRRTSVIKHKINLVHLFFITARQKIFDLPTQRKIKEEIKRLFDQGIIQLSTSPYSAGIFLVTKKDRSI